MPMMTFGASSLTVLSAAALAMAFPLNDLPEAPASDAPTTEVIAMDKDKSDRMTVPVHIDGKGPYEFVIDTGAQRTVMGDNIVFRLALEAEKPATLVSIAGISQVDMVYVPRLTFGSKHFDGLISPVLLSRDIGADGIIGLDSLQDQRILFDFRKKQLSVEDAKVQYESLGSREIVVTARKKSGQLIFTDATIAGIKVNVVIDTGGQVSVGNQMLQRKLRQRAKDTGDESTLIAVTGEKLAVEAGIAKNFRMDRVEFDQLPMVFADAPPFESLGLKDRPALLLGMDILRKFDQIAIDFKSRKIYLLLPRDARFRSEGFGF